MITPRFFCFVSGAPEVSCGTEGGGGGGAVDEFSGAGKAT